MGTDRGHDAELSDRPKYCYLERIPNELLFKLLQYFEKIELCRLRCLSETMNSRVNGYISSLKSFRLSGHHRYLPTSDQSHRERFNRGGCPCVERRTIKAEHELVSLEFDRVGCPEIWTFFKNCFPMPSLQHLKVRCKLDEDTANLLNSRPSNSLRSLAIWDDSYDNISGYVDLILQHHQETLQSVALVRFRYNLNKLSYKFEMLRKLFLAIDIDFPFFPPASTFNTLKRLELFDGKADLKLCNFPQLEYLSLNFVSSISLPDSLPQLKRLGMFPGKTRISSHGKQLSTDTFPWLQSLIVMYNFENEFEATLVFSWESFPVVLSDKIILMLNEEEESYVSEEEGEDKEKFDTKLSPEGIHLMEELKQVRLYEIKDDCIIKASAIIDSLHNVSLIQIVNCPPIKLLSCIKHKWNQTLDPQFLFNSEPNLDTKEQVLLEEQLNNLFGEKLNVRIQLHTYTSQSSKMKNYQEDSYCSFN